MASFQNLAEFAKKNDEFVAAFTQGGKPMPPARKALLITCMDGESREHARLEHERAGRDAAAAAAAAATAAVLANVSRCAWALWPACCNLLLNQTYMQAL